MVLSKKELGKLVKEARKIKSEYIGRKYTQTMLASDINRSQSYIGDIESGRTYPAFKVLNEISAACGVSLGFFENMKTNSTPEKSAAYLSGIVDIKSALDLLLSKPGLALNGELLSDNSKKSLAKAIQLGLEFAAEMQRED